MSKLKPCPFCGRKAELHYYEIDEPFTFTECGYEIYCCHCGIRFKERLNRIPQFDEKADIKKQNLIERWNRRVNDGVESNEADRPQGEWIGCRHEDSEWLSPMADFYKCSICGKRVNLFQMRSYRFCPNCGARMKGADDDNA